nr:Ig-like domain-containing protein [Gemmatimonadota bacterium]
PVNSVTVTPSSTSLTPTQTTTLTATTRDADNNVLTGRVVTWTSSNEAVATVSSTGVVTAGTITGTATITATSETKTGTATITVTPGPTASVVVSGPSTTVSTGEFLQLTAKAYDAFRNEITGKAFTWSSSDETVATVTPTDGNVSGVKPGGVTITATVDGESGTYQVNVTP